MARDRTLGLRLRAVDKMSSAIDRVQKRFPKLARSIRRASKASKLFNDQTKRLSRSLRKIGGGMRNFGRSMSFGVTLPLTAAAGAAVKMFADFEQGLRGVEKTTGLSRVEVAKLGERFDQLSTEIPVTTEEMLELAQAGGQLGIEGSADLEKFTVTMAKLGRAGDAAGEEAAKSIARILNVTGTSIKEVDRFAAALVDLGNNAEASESEILEMATRVSGQIGRFDVSAGQVLGLSTALKSLGKRSESGASVVGRAFDAIDQSISSGGEKIQRLSKITGIARKDLKQAFEKDATAVFQKFVLGLNKVETGGGNLVKVMEAMGLKGVRINDVLGTLAKRPEKLVEGMDRQARAVRENVALENEFQVQTESLSAELATLTNTLTSLWRMVGKDLAPAVGFLGDIFRKIFNFFRENPALRKLAIVLGAVLAIMGPIVFLLGSFLTVLPPVIGLVVSLAAAFGAITLPVLAIAAGIAALIAVVTAIIVKWDELMAFFDQNPFLKMAKSVIFLLNPLGQLVTMVKLIIDSFSGLDAVKNTLRDLMPESAANFLLGERTEPLGARERNRTLATPAREQRMAGRIDVNFANAPKGTRVRTLSDELVELNPGFSGGVQ